MLTIIKNTLDVRLNSIGFPWCLSIHIISNFYRFLFRSYDNHYSKCYNPKDIMQLRQESIKSNQWLTVLQYYKLLYNLEWMVAACAHAQQARGCVIVNNEINICVLDTCLKTNVLVRNPPFSGTFSISIICELSSMMCFPASGTPPVECCAKITRGFETGAMDVNAEGIAGCIFYIYQSRYPRGSYTFW